MSNSTSTPPRIPEPYFTKTDALATYGVGFGRSIYGWNLWQNRLNYSGSSALMIAAQLQSAQCTSHGTIPWSVASPPDTTTVQ
jgi:hypothetical protein